VTPTAITFDLVLGVRTSTRRAIGFLRGDPELNALEGFEALGEKHARDMLTFFGAWIDGLNGPATRFHGFPNHRTCRMCFVFKAREKRQGHRFYGFLCNPLPKTNASFQLCVLCIHAMKNEFETDQSELDRVKKWSESSVAREAIRVVYPDQDENEQKGRQRRWKN
jgi:hypothetical protein